MLDLEAQVAAHDVEQRAAVDVGRAQQLPPVPLAAGLPLDLLLGEDLGPVGEMAAKDNHMRPDVTGRVGREVAEQYGHKGGSGEQRECYIVLDYLASRFAPDAPQLPQHLVPALLTAQRPFDLGVVDRDSPLEEHRKYRVVERLGEVDRMPRLLRDDPHGAEADVAVLAENVGIGVVHVVVRVLPLLGGAGRVPLPGGGVDLGIAHPVPLPVQYVMTDFHVIQDFGGGQHRGARRPGRW